MQKLIGGQMTLVQQSPPGFARVEIAPPGTRVYLACGIMDMRKGMIGLAMLVQQNLAEDPLSGALYAFWGR